jgi:hypothetical protein
MIRKVGREEKELKLHRLQLEEPAVTPDAKYFDSLKYSLSSHLHIVYII